MWHPLDSIACSDGDKYLAMALGMILTGGLLLLWVACRIDVILTDKEKLA